MKKHSVASLLIITKKRKKINKKNVSKELSKFVLNTNIVMTKKKISTKRTTISTTKIITTIIMVVITAKIIMTKTIVVMKKKIKKKNTNVNKKITDVVVSADLIDFSAGNLKKVVTFDYPIHNFISPYPKSTLMCFFYFNQINCLNLLILIFRKFFEKVLKIC